MRSSAGSVDIAAKLTEALHRPARQVPAALRGGNAQPAHQRRIRSTSAWGRVHSCAEVAINESNSMMTKFAPIPCAIFLALASALPAVASPLIFTLSGTNSASFELDSSPTPSSFSDFGFLSQTFFNNVPGVYSGVGGIANINFGTGLAATFNLSNATLGAIQLNGPVVFTGSSSAPMFAEGVFSLTNPFFGINDELTISAAPSVSAAPELGTWALMLSGLGLLGLALRRRRERVGATAVV